MISKKKKYERLKNDWKDEEYMFENGKNVAENLLKNEKKSSISFEFELLLNK